MISGINVEGTWKDEPNEVKDEAYNFFKRRFSEEFF